MTLSTASTRSGHRGDDVKTQIRDYVSGQVPHVITYSRCYAALDRLERKLLSAESRLDHGSADRIHEDGNAVGESRGTCGAGLEDHRRYVGGKGQLAGLEVLQAVLGLEYDQFHVGLPTRLQA